MEASAELEAELWSRYRASSDQATRDRLFAYYAPWAESIARGVHGRIHRFNVDYEDYVQNAKIGLLEAITRFEPDRGVPFALYARRRVRGAVFNGLRALLGERRSPPEGRFNERLTSLREGASEDPFDQVVDAIVGLGLGVLLEACGSEPPAVPDGYHYAETEQINRELHRALERLPERLQMILRAHYFQHVPFCEIAGDLRLTKGRVSQLHKAALDQLRSHLRAFRASSP